MTAKIDRQTLKFLASKGFSEAQAAEIFGVSPQTVNHKAGIMEIRFEDGRKSDRRKLPPHLDPSVRISDMKGWFLHAIENGGTVSSMAKALDVDRHRIIFALNVCGLSARAGYR